MPNLDQNEKSSQGVGSHRKLGLLSKGRETIEHAEGKTLGEKRTADQWPKDRQEAKTKRCIFIKRDFYTSMVDLDYIVQWNQTFCHGA